MQAFNVVEESPVQQRGKFATILIGSIRDDLDLGQRLQVVFCRTIIKRQSDTSRKPSGKVCYGDVCGTSRLSRKNPDRYGWTTIK